LSTASTTRFPHSTIIHLLGRILVASNASPMTMAFCSAVSGRRMPRPAESGANTLICFSVIRALFLALARQSLSRGAPIIRGVQGRFGGGIVPCFRDRRCAFPAGVRSSGRTLRSNRRTVPPPIRNQIAGPYRLADHGSAASTASHRDCSGFGFFILSFNACCDSHTPSRAGKPCPPTRKNAGRVISVLADFTQAFESLFFRMR